MGKIPFIPAVMISNIITGIVISQPNCPPCDCVIDTAYGGVKAICSGLKLTSIPQTLPLNTSTLLIDNYDLKSPSLRNNSALRHLKCLDLSTKWLTDLDDDVFTGLTTLEVLVMDVNFLYDGRSTFDPRFLEPLTSLKNLSLGFNYLKNVTYECTFCSTCLQSLHIDWNVCRFGSSFLKLRLLSTLSLSSLACKIPALEKSTFQYTPYLKILNISNCIVQYVHPGIFDSLKNLRILDMRINLEFGDEFLAFMEVTKSLQFSPIEHISFKTRRTSQSSPDLFMYLQNTSLQQLHIIGENAPLIRKENYRKLPNSLVVLRLIHIQYDSTLTELTDHPSLKTLDLSNLASPYSSPKNFAISKLSPILESFICRECPNLRISVLSERKNLKGFITPHSKVIGILFSYYFWSLWKLEYIDLSNNAIEQFQLSFNNSVTHLNLASNNLGNSFTVPNMQTLNMLNNIKFLDLSDNGVSIVSMNAFENLHCVKILNLSNNNIKHFNVRLLHLDNLEVLDLSDNQISLIGTEARKGLARLPRAILHLKGNPLICGCEELEFLLWMRINKERIYNILSLQCRFPTDQLKTLNNLDLIISTLQAQCKSYIVEISVSVCVTICALAMVASVLVYRHRWKLRYLYYAGRRDYRQRHNREEVREHYEFDAFVSFDEMDRRFVIDEMMPELEEKHGLKLCIHQRDFHPGELISENIVNAIQNSRKTIVVLSPSFLESTWCEYEFNMARMEGVHRRQDVVLVLLYEDVPMVNLSKDMAAMLKRNCYLEYNHEVFNREVFWLLVQESVKNIRPRD